MKKLYYIWQEPFRLQSNCKNHNQILIMEGSFTIGEFKVFSTCLGQGSFGKVYEGIHIPTKDKVAVKIIDPKQSNIPVKPEVKEVEILKTVRSPNIVKYYDIYKNDGKFLLFFEFCESDLMKEISKKSESGQYLKEEEVIEILKQILNGFKILYQNKIIHRDIKPENILVKDGAYKIADFGFARFVEDLDDLTDKTKLGSPIYTAPQILDNKRYSSKCDVWSLGILLYQLLYYKVPFDVTTTQELRKIVPKRAIVLPTEPKRSEKLKQFINKMLKIEEHERMDWPEIFLHDLVKTHEPADEEAKKAKDVVQRILKFHKNICDYVSQIAKHFYCLQNSLQMEVYYGGMLALNSFILYLCKLTIEFFFAKQFPHPSVDIETWRKYKTTKYYWIFLKNMKDNNIQFQVFIEQVKDFFEAYSVGIPQNILPAIKLLCDKKYDEQKYILIMNWVIEHMMKSSNIPVVLIQQMEKCKNPLKHFNLETDIEALEKEVEERISKAALGM